MSRKFFGLSAILGIFALVLTAAGVLYAQQDRGGMGGGMMGMMQMMRDCPMMRAMNESPAAVLRQRQALRLSDAQVSRLRALESSGSAMPAGMMAQMRAIQQEIARASEGDRFDEAAVRAAFGRMAALHTEMGVSMLRTRAQVRQILTPEQRKTLDARRGGGMMNGGMMNGGMGGMMKDGMKMDDCPMMGGGMGGMRGMMGRDSAPKSGTRP